MQLFRNRRGDSRTAPALTAMLDFVLFCPEVTRYVRQTRIWRINFYRDGDGKPAKQL